MLLKRPGYTVAGALALALGIGANTAIFSVVNAVLLRPLPFDSPQRLVMLWESVPRPGSERIPASAANYADWRREAQSFEHVAAFRTWAWPLAGDTGTELIWGARASANLFPALGVRPLLGRTFTEDEDRAGGARVVLLGHGLWQRRFGGDPSVVGKTVRLGEQSYEVVGVMPAGFKFPADANMLAGLQFSPKTEMWQPLALGAEEAAERGTRNLAVLGRLRAGVTAEQGGAEMKALSARLGEQYPNFNRGVGAVVVPLHEQVVGDVRPALLVLLGTVGFVLLIACANVANLMLARAASRRKEIAVRTALGASRARIIRQLLTESLLLALVGGGAGLLLAAWGIEALGAFVPESIPRAREIGIDARMLVFTLGVSVFTGFVFGLVPALQASKTDINESLKDGARGSAGPGRSRLRSALVVSEVALSLVLLVGAGLLIRSFARLLQVEPGFDPANVTASEIVLPFLPPSKYEASAAQAAFFRELDARARALPGVEAAGLVSSLPLSGAVENTNISIEGREAPPPGQEPVADYALASAGYFRAMSIPVIKGRAFETRDTADSQRVAIISEALARRHWPAEDPVGKQLRIGFEDAPREVVGVVGDVKQTGLAAETSPAVYMPFEQFPYPGMTLVVRSSSGGGAAAVASAVRREVGSIDANVPVSNVRSLTEVVAASLAERRFSMTLLGVFAAAALLLAAVGVYGVMAYSVSLRAHEIGVRMALGAQGGDVLRLVLREGMRLALAGVGCGVAATLVVTRAMRGLLYGVGTADPLTYAGVSLLLALVALAACYIPARRATKVDPLWALRYE